MKETNRAVVTVVGKDTVGILAKVSQAAAAANANVQEVTQSVLEEFFTMIMLLDISEATRSIAELESDIRESIPTMQVHVMHENIFNSMHRI